MPPFDNFEIAQTVKMLYIGDSGAGKTGSLCSLAAAGYNVRILDLDKGVSVISDFLKNPASIYTKAREGLWTDEQAKTILSRMSYVTINEDIKVIQGQIVPDGKMWNKISDQLNNWLDGGLKLGNISSWGPQDVLVIDGLSRAAQAALNYQLAMGGHLIISPTAVKGYDGRMDVFHAQQLVERLLTLLYSSEVKCNVVMICHLTFIETEAGPTKGFPQAVGNKLSPKIGQYFNHALLAKSSGSGANVKRVIVTGTSGMVELKNTAPLRVKAEYDLSTGLAEYFRDVRATG